MSRQRVWLLLFACIVLGPSRSLSAATSQGKEGPAVKTATRVVLGDVDRYRVVEPVAEGVRVILSYRGEKYSPAYLQGISGAAFRIAGPCPCAPTCWGTMGPAELARLFGYEVEQIDIGAPYGDPAKVPGAKEEERKKRMQAALVRIKHEIRAGRPAVLVQAFTTWEYDVVCGFDEDKHELYGRGSYDAMRTDAYAHADEMRALGATEIGGGPYAVLVKERVGRFDAKAAEMAALKEAVAHAHTRAEPGKLRMGLECYDAWIEDYRSKSSQGGKGLPPDQYPLSILPTTRQAASQFLLELAANYPDAKAHLELASEAFAGESAALQAAQQFRKTIREDVTPEQSARMAGLLDRARAMYALAIDEVARAVAKMSVPKSAS